MVNFNVFYIVFIGGYAFSGYVEQSPYVKNWLKGPEESSETKMDRLKRLNININHLSNTTGQ